MKHLALALSLVLACAVFAASGAANAQETGRAAAKSGSKTSGSSSNVPKRPKKAKRANAKDREKAPVRNARNDKPADTAPAVPAADADHPSHVPPPSEDAAALAADADERVRKEAGEEIKTVEFGGLDIEGQLKTPQMLYFLNRLRAEFSRPELPHRSFIPELQRGTQENGF
jgi:hypothetical protein